MFRTSRPCWASVVTAALALATLPSASWSADCNGNGRGDSVDVESGAADCNGNGVPDECDVAVPTFDLGVESDILWNVTPAIVDFDGDGQPDAVVAVNWFARLGLVVFSPIVASTLAPAAMIDVPLRSTVLAAGDVDGDGRGDIVVRDEVALTWLRGDGAGGFESTTTLPLDGRTDEMRVADADGDGFGDAILRDEREDRVTIVFGTGAGLGGVSVASSMGDEPRSMDVGDVDGDGRLDIVTANWRSGDVSVSRQVGEREWRETRFVASGERPQVVRLVDLDDDGQLDVVLATVSTIEVLHGDGRGDFVPGRSFSIREEPVRGPPQASSYGLLAPVFALAAQAGACRAVRNSTITPYADRLLGRQRHSGRPRSRRRRRPRPRHGGRGRGLAAGAWRWHVSNGPRARHRWKSLVDRRARS